MSLQPLALSDTFSSGLVDPAEGPNFSMGWRMAPLRATGHTGGWDSSSGLGSLCCSPHELKSRGPSQWRPQEDKQVGVILTRTYWGEMNIATFQKKKIQTKGCYSIVLIFTSQNMWKCFIFKLLTLRTVFIKMWLEDCQADVQEILFMQCLCLA